ncbi:MAG: prolipoprotein diacylglyceryl transferase [Phycisphaerae bacterium]|jgi:phosphatidylglycerol:prolipoprotein diacylglycerol transferase|nr:prolipoprotein diacylglyceryl transferase [Phycisphaerae bacterium]
MLQTIIDFGNIELFGLSLTPRIYGYGLMLVLGFISGIWLAHWRAKRMGENHETVTVVGILSLVGGIVGARLAFILQNWSQFSKSHEGLSGIIDVTSGGLIYYGGVLLGTLMVVLYLRHKRIAIRRYLDIVAVSLMVGLAFGRAGCFLNGCCYGGKCDADWPLATQFPMYSKPLLKFDGRPNPFSVGSQGVSPVYAHQLEQRAIALHKLGKSDSPALAAKEQFDGLLNPDPTLVDSTSIPRSIPYTHDGKKAFAPVLPLLPPESFSDEQVHVASASLSLPIRPAQALGFFNALLLAALLCAFFRHRRREGQVFAVLLIVYPITRFLLEGIRIDTALHYGMTHNQYTSLATVAAGIFMLFVISKLPPSAGPTWAERLTAAKARENVRSSAPKRDKRKR